MKPDKNKDQHIMLDSTFNERMISVSRIVKTDHILEIGGGPGNLTELLAEHAGRVYAVEKDSEYSSLLKKKFKDVGNVRVISGNILEIDLPDFNKIASNPPYSILQSFFFRLVQENRQDFECCTMIVPHKFTKLITDVPESVDFGVLSALFYAFYDVEVVADVPKEAFTPQPRVTSHMIRITQKENKDLISSVLRNLFYNHKKKIRNALLDMFWNSPNGIAGRKRTKREATGIVASIEEKTGELLLNKNVFQLSNAEMKSLLTAFMHTDGLGLSESVGN